ncbi:unnamed protein product [Jaminaea pallidilutea]
MSSGPPSWAATQRQPAHYRPPQSANSFDSRLGQQAPSPHNSDTGNANGSASYSNSNLGRMGSRSSQADSYQARQQMQSQQQQQQQQQTPQMQGFPRQPSPNSAAFSQGNRSSSYDALGSSQQAHRQSTDQNSDQSERRRKTQSLRPFSAFQPMDQADPYASREGSSPGNRPPSPTGSTNRSIRASAAPLTFKSPELRSALFLQDAQQRKMYMEGYLSRRDALGADGKPLHPNDPKKAWHLCFVQLSGTVLSVWSVQQMEQAAREGREVPPSYVNVTDSFVDLIGNLIEDPKDVPGSRGRYENVFALNSAGNNRILFCVEGAVGRRLVQAWINAIRLASWEKVRLEEIYTGALIRARLGTVGAGGNDTGPMQGPPPAIANLTIASPLSKGKMEGWVKARFMGSTEWRKCWLVLSRDKGEVTSPGGGSMGRRLWNKLGGAGDRSSIMSITSNDSKNPTSPTTPGRSNSISGTLSNDMEPPPGSNGAPGIAQFYASKKDKRPFANMLYASHAFAVYPSRPELVEGSSLFKVEGAFPNTQTTSATNRVRQTGWVMIMPELEQSSTGANAEMMKWTIAFMDAFQLYGRPDNFVWDARNPVSAFFAYPIGQYKERLFLDRELAEFLDVREERHLATRANLHSIMAARMRGERTPLLPPLPQPNTNHTRQLNGGKGGSPAGDQAMQQNQQQTTPQPDQPPQSLVPGANAIDGGSGRASEQGRDSEGDRARGNENATGSAAPALAAGAVAGGAGLAAAHSTDSRDDQRFTQPSNLDQQHQGSDRAPFNQATASSSKDNGPVPSADRHGAAASQGANVSRDGNAGLPAAAESSNQDQPVEQRADPTVNSILQAPATTATPPPPFSKNPAPQGSAVPAPSGRGAEPMSASQSGPILSSSDPVDPSLAGPKSGPRLSEGDLSTAYDEGALFYLRSMADNLPASQAKPTVLTNASGLAATGRPKDSPIAETPSSYTQSSFQPSRNTSLRTPITPFGTNGPFARTQDNEDRLDEDALAAYSYLDRQSSSHDGGAQQTGPGAAAAAVAAAKETPSPAAAMQPALATSKVPPAAGPSGQTSYPSSFEQNKKGQERRQAAQAQAVAQAQAISTPGKPGGQRKGLKPQGRRARGQESSEEEPDEDQEDLDARLAYNRAPAGNTASGSRDMQQGMAPPNAQYQQGRSGSPAVQAAAAAGLPPPPGMPGALNNRASFSSSRGGHTESGRGSPLTADRQGNASPNSMVTAPQSRAGSAHPALSQRQSGFLGPPHGDEDGRSIASSNGGASQRQTFVQYDPQQQQNSSSAGIYSHGLLEAASQDKQDRSAKQQEMNARQSGMSMVSAPTKPPPPQAGLLGAITAHERDRQGAGGLGATMTERERQRVEAERRQREEYEAAARQTPMMGGQGQWGQQGMMPGFNPYMWQQMMMMNPMMMGMGGGMPGYGHMSPNSQSGGFGGSQAGGHEGYQGSQSGHGNAMSPNPQQQMDPYMMQQQQMAAAMAAQQAYMQAMAQHGGGGQMGQPNQGGGDPSQGTPQMPMSPTMMSMGGFPHPMSMYGMPSMMGGYPMMGGHMGHGAGSGALGSDYGSGVGHGTSPNPPPQQARRYDQQSQAPGPGPAAGRPGQTDSPLRR